MTLSCKDRERIFFDGTAEEWLALEAHAATCAECAQELLGWKQLSVAAAELRDHRENPALWTKIEASLLEQSGSKRGLPGWMEHIFAGVHFPKIWQLALTGALVLTLALAGGYLFVHRDAGGPIVQNGFLKDKALAEVERTEHDYMKAIDRLAIEAKPQLETDRSPLMASYQEKLILLDSAIDELRVQSGQNPSNAHLRYQLLSMYQAKEATLQDILETKR
jgi:hypothetical protein